MGWVREKKQNHKTNPKKKELAGEWNTRKRPTLYFTFPFNERVMFVVGNYTWIECDILAKQKRETSKGIAKNIPILLTLPSPHPWHTRRQQKYLSQNTPCPGKHNYYGLLCSSYAFCTIDTTADINQLLGTFFGRTPVSTLPPPQAYPKHTISISPNTCNNHYSKNIYWDNPKKRDTNK